MSEVTAPEAVGVGKRLSMVSEIEQDREIEVKRVRNENERVFSG